MGAFDEAIREHLDLKRKHGAAEQDLARQEQEALGRGTPPALAPQETEQPLAVDDVALPTAPDPTPPAEGVEQTPESARAALAEPDELDLESHDQSSPPAMDEVAEPLEPEVVEEVEPDEVLPDEALEPSTPQEDVLEETPEFLEETPEQDRLWFEQRAPKDFDFGD